MNWSLIHSYFNGEKYAETNWFGASIVAEHVQIDDMSQNAMKALVLTYSERYSKHKVL